MLTKEQIEKALASNGKSNWINESKKTQIQELATTKDATQIGEIMYAEHGHPKGKKKAIEAVKNYLKRLLTNIDEKSEVTKEPNLEEDEELDEDEEEFEEDEELDEDEEEFEDDEEFDEDEEFEEEVNN